MNNAGEDATLSNPPPPTGMRALSAASGADQRYAITGCYWFFAASGRVVAPAGLIGASMVEKPAAPTVRRRSGIVVGGS